MDFLNIFIVLFILFILFYNSNIEEFTVSSQFMERVRNVRLERAVDIWNRYRCIVGCN